MLKTTFLVVTLIIFLQYSITMDIGLSRSQFTWPENSGVVVCNLSLNKIFATFLILDYCPWIYDRLKLRWSCTYGAISNDLFYEFWFINQCFKNWIDGRFNRIGIGLKR